MLNLYLRISRDRMELGIFFLMIASLKKIIIIIILQKFVLKSTTGSKTTLLSSYRWQQTLGQGGEGEWGSRCLNRNGTEDHHCLRHCHWLPFCQIC